MRTVTFKKENGEKVDFITSLTGFELSQEDPFGITYRTSCSTTLSLSEQEEFWNYVDSLLSENPIPNFESVWRIVEGQITYGYQN